MSLREYQKKRDFKKTAEPRLNGCLNKEGHRFIVQKHDASRLHYDFRLEMEGVLKSWAVPKGFPWTKGEKHLAVHVEDHPIEYAKFEGIIPKGQYGGGTVMVWDQGELRSARHCAHAGPRGREASYAAGRREAERRVDAGEDAKG